MNTMMTTKQEATKSKSRQIMDFGSEGELEIQQKNLQQVVLLFSDLILPCNIFQTVLNQNKNAAPNQSQMCI